MMADYHVHTQFSDGKDTLKEMVHAAIEKGMDAIGFSDHSYTFFDESYCMAKEKEDTYRAEILALREKYQDKIKIYCGIEQDAYSDRPTAGYDYVIGSVHYLKLGEEYIPVDETPEILISAAEKYFAGDMLSLVEAYFKTVARVVEMTDCDIIGHFDLITKFNRNNALFDENSPRYQAAAESAVKALLPYGRVFEINTGAMARGLRDGPYPAKCWQEKITKGGGRLVYSSDSHSKETLCYAFA